jgi:anti-sigma factor RsiW
VHEPNAHLSDWTLDLLAEDALSHAERTAAEAHLRGCARCSGELDAARAVITALSSLPHFEPSPSFPLAVMSRVVPLPRQAAAQARVRRWLPKTRRGWAMMGALSVAPLASMAALLAWLLSHPMVSAGALLGMGERWVRHTAWSLLARGAEALVKSGAWQWVADGAAGLARMSTEQLSVAAITLAILIPASGWVVARLLRTPVGGMTHAH